MKNEFGVEREQEIQNAVADAGFPAPPVWWSGTYLSALGRGFVIMPFVDGRDPLAEGAARHVPVILAETMIQLHGLGRQVLQNFVTAGGIVEATDIGSVTAILGRNVSDGVRAARDWFGTHPVETEAAVLCHGDLHAQNLLLKDGRVATVLDWELATFAPPEYDVARTELLLQLMPGVGGRLLRPVVRMLGRRLARQFMAAYRKRAKLDDEMLVRCRALQALRLIGLVRSPFEEVNERVRQLWLPFEGELVGRWQSITGTNISR